jgi:hypothetical protein
MEGTKLWIRLLKEGRMLESPDTEKSFPYFANFSPKRMTRVELLSGYLELVEQVRNWRHFEARVKGMVSRVQRRPQVRARVSRKRDWKQLVGALKFLLFQMDREARGVTCRLILYTARQAPFMMGRVAWAIISQYMLATQLPQLRESITTLLQREAKGELQWQPKKPAFFVPEAFKKPFKAIFPELHERVYRGLIEKSRTHDALVEVTYDFLTRWGPTFEGFAEHHRVFLDEICDRTIAKENRELAREEADGPMQGLGQADALAPANELPDIRRTRLADAVLHAVEQELRHLQPTTQAVAPLHS